MALLRSTWTLLYLLASIAMGISQTKPDGPQNAINLNSALEVTNLVMGVRAASTGTLPVNDEGVKAAVEQMCPLIQYNYEVKDLIESEQEVSTATQAMDVLLDSIVEESCDWLTSILGSTVPNFSCSIEYLSLVCAEKNLYSHVYNLQELLLNKLYKDKSLRPDGPHPEAKKWIQATFSGHSATKQESVLDIITPVPAYATCAQVNGAVTCQ